MAGPGPGAVLAPTAAARPAGALAARTARARRHPLLLPRHADAAAGRGRRRPPPDPRRARARPGAIAGGPAPEGFRRPARGRRGALPRGRQRCRRQRRGQGEVRPRGLPAGPGRTAAVHGDGLARQRHLAAGVRGVPEPAPDRGRPGRGQCHLRGARLALRCGRWHPPDQRRRRQRDGSAGTPQGHARLPLRRGRRLLRHPQEGKWRRRRPAPAPQNQPGRHAGTGQPGKGAERRASARALGMEAARGQHCRERDDRNAARRPACRRPARAGE